MKKVKKKREGSKNGGDWVSEVREIKVNIWRDAGLFIGGNIELILRVYSPALMCVCKPFPGAHSPEVS